MDHGPSDGFEAFVSRHFAELQRRVVAEHARLVGLVHTGGARSDGTSSSSTFDIDHEIYEVTKDFNKKRCSGCSTHTGDSNTGSEKQVSAKTSSSSRRWSKNRGKASLSSGSSCGATSENDAPDGDRDKSGGAPRKLSAQAGVLGNAVMRAKNELYGGFKAGIRRVSDSGSYIVGGGPNSIARSPANYSSHKGSLASTPPPEPPDPTPVRRSSGLVPAHPPNTMDNLDDFFSISPSPAGSRKRSSGRSAGSDMSELKELAAELKQRRKQEAAERFANVDAKVDLKQQQLKAWKHRRSVTWSGVDHDLGDIVTEAVRRHSISQRRISTDVLDSPLSGGRPITAYSSAAARRRVSFAMNRAPKGCIDECQKSDDGGGRDSGILHECSETSTLNSSLASSEGDQQFQVLGVWYSSSHARTWLHSSARTKTQVFTKGGRLEDEDGRGNSFWMMRPSSGGNIAWDLFGLLLIAWDCFTIPFAFFDDTPQFFTTTSQPAWVGRVYWTLNMIASFNTGYISDDGGVVMNRWKVARRYCLTWLPLDAFIVSSDWLEIMVYKDDGIQYHRIGTTLRTLRMIRTLRLLRMVKAPVLTNHLSEQIRSEELLLVAHIFKIMVIMLIIAHFVACFWYAIGSSDKNTGWVHLHQATDGSLPSYYILSLHWSLSMFVGETLMQSQNMTEQGFTVGVLFFGFVFSSSLVSSLTTAMTRLQMITRKQSQQMSQLRRYLVNKSIRRPLSVRIQRNAQHILLEQKRNMPEASIELLKVISEPLRVEIHFAVYSETFLNHPFFYCFNDMNPSGMRSVCHTCVTEQSLSMGDVLFSELEVPTIPRMYFLKRGQTQYEQEGDAKTPKPLLQNSGWFCEPVLWTSWTHCGTIRAKLDCAMLLLDAAGFQRISSEPFNINLSRYAEAYVAVLNEQAGRETLSDVGALDADLEDIIAYSFPDHEINDTEQLCFEHMRSGKSPRTSIISEDECWRAKFSMRRQESRMDNKWRSAPAARLLSCVSNLCPSLCHLLKHPSSGVVRSNSFSVPSAPTSGKLPLVHRTGTEKSQVDRLMVKLKKPHRGTSPGGGGAVAKASEDPGAADPAGSNAGARDVSKESSEGNSSFGRRSNHDDKVAPFSISSRSPSPSETHSDRDDSKPRPVPVWAHLPDALAEANTVERCPASDRGPGSVPERSKPNDTHVPWP